jgi:tRNA1Val (adenine37-N6)-methyltransferase
MRPNVCCLLSFSPMETNQARLLDGSLLIEQPAHGYRVGFDPLLLSAFAPQMSEGAKVMDLGCGVGAVFLSLALRQPGLSITAVDRETEFCSLARANVHLNNLSDVTVVEDDIRQAASSFAKTDFDLVLANPPFYPKGSGRLSTDQKRAAAHHELHGGLEDWLRCGEDLTTKDGWFCLIHLAERKDECLQTLAASFTSIEWLSVKPQVTKPANRVLIRACKSGIPSVRQLPDLILHQADGSLTQRASSVINTCSRFD